MTCPNCGYEIEKAKEKCKEFHFIDMVKSINEIVDKKYENIKEQGKILEEIEKVHRQIRFKEPHLAEYIKKRMLCRAKEKDDLP